MELFSCFPLFLRPTCVSWIASQLQPKHCADTISAARHRKQRKQMPKKGEVQKEKPGAESLRKDRTVATTSVFIFLLLIITISLLKSQSASFFWTHTPKKSACHSEAMHRKVNIILNQCHTVANRLLSSSVSLGLSA